MACQDAASVRPRRATPAVLGLPAVIFEGGKQGVDVAA